MADNDMNDYARGYRSGMETMEEEFLALKARHARLVEAAREALEGRVDDGRDGLRAALAEEEAGGKGEAT